EIPIAREAMSAGLQARLWYLQRISAMVLAVCVVIHLLGIVYVSRGGLSAAEILSRTRRHALFAGYYAGFGVACAVHVRIGLKSIAEEWWRLPAHWALVAASLIALLLLAMGLRAVYAVTF